MCSTLKEDGPLEILSEQAWNRHKLLGLGSVACIEATICIQDSFGRWEHWEQKRGKGGRGAGERQKGDKRWRTRERVCAGSHLLVTYQTLIAGRLCARPWECNFCLGFIGLLISRSVFFKFEVFNHYFFKKILRFLLSLLSLGDPACTSIRPRVAHSSPMLCSFVSRCPSWWVSLAVLSCSLPFPLWWLICCYSIQCNFYLSHSSLEDQFGSFLSSIYLLNMLTFPSTFSYIWNVITVSMNSITCIISGSVDHCSASLWVIFSYYIVSW